MSVRLRPKQRVIVYRHGLKPLTRAEKQRIKRDEERAQMGYVPCPRCGKHLKNEGQNHYLDQTNKIHCIERH